MIRVRVAEGIQVNHDGQVVPGGEVVEVDELTAARWAARRWAERVPDDAPKRSRRPQKS